jgi:hypothetical protein
MPTDRARKRRGAKVENQGKFALIAKLISYEFALFNSLQNSVVIGVHKILLIKENPSCIKVVPAL